MRRVLLIAHQFPPLGGGGVQRSVKFVRHMPAFGYEPVVVTGPRTASGGRWRPTDPTLDAQVGDAEVHRVLGPAPGPSRGMNRRIERILDRPSAFVQWWIEGVQECATRIPRIDVVVGTLGPYATAPAAVEVAKRLKTPLVLDFRDPWALDEVLLYPSYFHRARDLARMHRALLASDAVVMNTREATRRVLGRFPDVVSRLITTIPSGFEPEDFQAVPAAAREEPMFRIVHAGGLYAELGYSHRRTRLLRRMAGGTPVPGVDFLPRSHLVLIDAIDRLLTAEPGLRSSLEVCLAGVMSATDLRIAASSPVVRVAGFQPHRETVSLLKSADLLFLPMHDLPAGVRAGLIPGKTYEYLAAGRPILAAVPEGDARDLLEESGAAIICPPSDAGAIAMHIRAELDRWRAGRPCRTPDPRVVSQFHWNPLMEHMARVLDAAIEGARTPGFRQ